jgi:hypothetical protein
MFGSMLELQAAGKLLQPIAAAAAAPAASPEGEDAATGAPHTVISLMRGLFKEFQMMVDPPGPGGAVQYPAFARMGVRYPGRAMASLVSYAYADFEGPLSDFPQIRMPDGIADAEPAEFVSACGDNCASPGDAGPTPRTPSILQY